MDPILDMHTSITTLKAYCLSTNNKLSLSLFKIFISFENIYVAEALLGNRDILKISNFYKTRPRANQFNNPKY